MAILRRREFLGMATAAFTSGQLPSRALEVHGETAELLRATVSPLPAVPGERFEMGTSHRSNGQSLRVDARSLVLDGKRWLPAMGEFHYARYPQDLWKTELLKMKAGGLEVVSTYVFWIFHEEQQGLWRWNGKRDLRKFAQLCKDAGLLLVVRCGPWCHGEVRNGGFPDWLQHSGCKLRSTDPIFLGFARELYRQIATQIAGLLWKDGGPVIGIQVDNEYGGPAEYLLALKKIAIEMGIDVPLYNRTGWPRLSTPMPGGQLLPLYGAYADGFWDRSLVPIPSGYLSSFVINPAPNSQAAAMGASTTPGSKAGATRESFQYPYFCCELGGGMETSYHRRIRIDPMDVYSTAMVKLASGNCLQGYYMYHGGTNPHGRLTPMEETQASGGYNDLPQLSYDFYAPLGEYGEVRPHYNLLRKLHLFQQVEGDKLANARCVIPPRPANFSWSVRAGNDSGYLFVNNYAMLTPHPAVDGVRFEVNLPHGKVMVPSQPGTIPADSSFFWQIGTNLTCTSQPLLSLEVSGRHVHFYQQIPGIPAEWQLNLSKLQLTHMGRLTRIDSRNNAAILLTVMENSREIAFEYAGADGLRHQVVLLSAEDAAALTLITVGTTQHAVLCRHPVWQDGAHLIVDTPLEETTNLAIMPPLSLKLDNKSLHLFGIDGVFTSYTIPATVSKSPAVHLTKVRSAGPARKISIGRSGVAEAPEEADFLQAAVWNVEVDWSNGHDAQDSLILQVHYVGDCARFLHDNRLLVDNFYNGRPFSLCLDTAYFGSLRGTIQLEILPLQKDAPIYLPASAIPQFDANATPVAEVERAQINARRHIALRVD